MNLFAFILILFRGGQAAKFNPAYLCENTSLSSEDTPDKILNSKEYFVGSIFELCRLFPGGPNQSTGQITILPTLRCSDVLEMCYLVNAFLSY